MIALDRPRVFSLSLAALASGSLAACGGSPKPIENRGSDAKPTSTRFAELTEVQRCAATERRALPCADELFLANARAMGMDLSDERGKPTDDDERKILHANSCVGDANYADSIFACWDTKTCVELVACVEARRSKR